LSSDLTATEDEFYIAHRGSLGHQFGGNRGQELSIIDDSLPSLLLSTGRLPSNNKAGRICADTLYSGEVMYLDW
jgi:hypothetical protein